MPSRRAQLEAWETPIAATGWLPVAADGALYGLVEAREGDWCPIYSYHKLVQLLGLEAAAAFIAKPDGPWFIWPPDKPSFWAKVKTRELVAWENMTPAILGVGWRLPQGECVVYDRGLLIDMLMTLYIDSRRLPDSKRLKDAERYFESNMLQANFGKATPIYVWRLPD